MKVKFKKLTDNAIIPSYAKPGDAGLDMTAISTEVINEHTVKYDTGIAVEIPEGHVGLLFPRSSVYKSGNILTNSVGVIDSGYRGSIGFIYQRGWEDFKVGDRIGQLIIIPYPKIEIEEAQELVASARGETGWGSSGR